MRLKTGEYRSLYIQGPGRRPHLHQFRRADGHRQAHFLKLTIQDDSWQLKFDNPDTGAQPWYIGTSDDSWAASEWQTHI
ncbi:MAG: hypothetical protein R3B47_02890 [Bacteroidia bacterium]